MIRLLIVDDQPLICHGLTTLLPLEGDIEVVGEANNGLEAIALADDLAPDVVLMDMRMPVCDGVSATRRIHQAHPNMKILVLTTFEEDELIVESLKAGASGYVLKNLPPKQLVDAIRAVHKGITQIDSTIMPRVLDRLGSSAKQRARDTTKSFSERELEVLKLLADGLSNREIAQALHLSEGTVKNHISNILSILSVRDRTQAVLWALKNIL